MSLYQGHIEPPVATPAPPFEALPGSLAPAGAAAAPRTFLDDSIAQANAGLTVTKTLEELEALER